MEEPEDSGTTQKEDVKKTPAIMLASILSITCTIPSESGKKLVAISGKKLKFIYPINNYDF